MEATEKSTAGTPKELQIDLLALLKSLASHRILFPILLACFVVGGYALSKVLPKEYRASVKFAFHSAPGANSRLQQLAALAGNVNLKQEGSPFITHLETFAQSHEVTYRMLPISYRGVPLPQVLLGESLTPRDSNYAFHSTLNSMCEIKRKEEAFELRCSTNEPALSAFLAENLFQTITRTIDEKRRESLGRKLDFIDSLHTAYRRTYDASADRLKTFSMKNFDATSPDILLKKEQLMIEKRMNEERYLLSMREQEELKIQFRQDDVPLVVLENAYVPLFPYFPSVSKCVFAAVAIFLCLYVFCVAFFDRKKWIRET